jgi:large subunit ribosomal protein L10
MAITKAKKGALVEKLDASLKDAQSMVFVQFKKLKVADTMKLRRKLRAENVGYTVIKKTLMKRVLASKGITGTLPELLGEVAIAYSVDSLAPAREVYSFSKDFKDHVAIVGGVYEGKFLNQEEMLAMATIPPLPVLYGQFVGLLASPVRSFVVALDQIAQKKQA